MFPIYLLWIKERLSTCSSPPTVCVFISLFFSLSLFFPFLCFIFSFDFSICLFILVLMKIPPSEHKLPFIFSFQIVGQNFSPNLVRTFSAPLLWGSSSNLICCLWVTLNITEIFTMLFQMPLGFSELFLDASNKRQYIINLTSENMFREHVLKTVSLPFENQNIIIALDLSRI